MARPMTSDEVRGFLSHGRRTAKVATVMADGRPHVMPVWFVLDSDQVVFTTGATSVKGCDLRRDPRIALVVDDENPPEILVRVEPERVIAEDDVAG